jgi:ABC-type glutathione transport system ATPase component
MADALIEAVELSKSYPRYGGVLRRRIGMVQAVDHVSLSLRAGETLGLVGESGCGKTTLAKMLVGLVRPTYGHVLIRGQRLHGLRGAQLRAARRIVQFVFQDPMNSLNPRMTVGQILSEPLIIHRLASGAERRARVETLLAAVQLPAGYARRLPRELSGGERQRVGIARAIAVGPEALICDEPIAALDVSVGAQVLQLLRTLSQERRMTLLFISHDLRAVAALCERIAVMRQGRLVEVGPSEQVLGSPGSPYTALLVRAAALDLDAPELAAGSEAT